MSQREGLAQRAMRQRLAKLGRPPTMLEVAVTRAGARRGGEAVTSLLMWTVARHKKGGERPTAEDLARTELVTAGAGYKHQLLLREVWGGDEGIGAMADVVVEAHGTLIAKMAKLSGDDSGAGRDLASGMLLVGSLPAVGLAL